MKRTGLSLLALLFLLACSLHAEWLMDAYPQAVGPDSAWILVECDSQAPATVEYGTGQKMDRRAVTADKLPTDASPVTWVHRVPLRGLKPDTVYYYRASQGGGFTNTASFRTAPRAGKPFRFAWMADCRTGVDVHDLISKAIFEARPAFSLYGGDMCIRAGHEHWREEFFRPAERRLIASVPFFLSPGNHEKWETNTKAYTRGPDSASKTPDYYSFDWGDLHVLMINNELPVTEGSPQWNFARKDLAASRKPWKVAFSHKPGYCAGGHDEDAEMIAFIEKVLRPGGVKVLFSGHSHFYQRNAVNGMNQCILGSAGAPLAEPKQASYTVKAAKVYTYGIVDVTATTFDLVVYTEKGQVFDRLTLHR